MKTSMIILFAVAATLGASCTDSYASKSGSRSDSKSHSQAPAPYCAPKSNAPSPAPAPAPAASPAPSASPAPAPAPSVSAAPVAAPAAPSQAARPTQSQGLPGASSSGWRTGSTVGHPLTWPGTEPTKPDTEIEVDPPSSGGPTIRIDYPPEVRVVKEVELVAGPERIEREIIQTAAVFFRTGSDRLSDEGLRALRLLAHRAAVTDGAEVAVATGHADITGTRAGNLDLSARRAGAVRAALVLAGVPPEAITTTAMGDADPVAPGDLALNRRTEVVLRAPKK